MKLNFKQYNSVLVLFLVTFLTFGIIRSTTELKKLRKIIYLSPFSEPWLIITENNNSHWKITIEDTLKKIKFLVVDTLVEKGELNCYLNDKIKFDRPSKSIFLRVYLNGHKLNRLNISGGGCESITSYLNPPYE